MRASVVLVLVILMAVSIAFLSRQKLMPEAAKTAQSGSATLPALPSETTSAEDAMLETRVYEPYPLPSDWVYIPTITPDATRMALPATAIAATEIARMDRDRQEACGLPCLATPAPLIVHFVCNLPGHAGGPGPDIGVLFEQPDAPTIANRYWTFGIRRHVEQLAFDVQPSASQSEAIMTYLNCQP